MYRFKQAHLSAYAFGVLVLVSVYNNCTQTKKAIRVENYPYFQTKPVLTLVQKEILDGNAFRFYLSFKIPAANNNPGIYDILINHGPKPIVLFSRLVKSNMPDILYEVYAAPVATAGTILLPTHNMDGRSQKVSGLELSLPSAISSVGTQVDLHILTGGTEVGNRLHGEESIDADAMKIQPANKTSLLRFTNPNNEEAEGFIYLKWFEDTYR